jgi:hypothetical protein
VTLVAGRYRLVEPLGGGGTSLVHRATPVGGGADVAIKTLRPQFAADPALRRRFLREAELARRLDHPSIVRVLEVGETVGENGGAPFIALELVRGETLRQLMTRLGRLPPSAARSIFTALANALDHAHGRGVLHRDVKPENVFVDDWTVKLGDFGNARVVSLASVTGASLTWGTPEYVAPEVFVRGRADPRSDLYSLGVVYHEMLTGRLPWTRAETLTRIGAGARAVIAPTGAGAAVDRLVAELLSPAAGDRPASGDEAVARLESPATTALAAAKPACASCGAPRPGDVPRCLACGQEILRLRHDYQGRWRVVLDSLADDAAATEDLLRVLDPLVRPPGQPLTFITGNRNLYSEGERKRGIHLPAVLVASLDEPTARALSSLCRAGGLETRPIEGTGESLDPPKYDRSVWRHIFPFGAVAAGMIAWPTGSIVLGGMAGAALTAMLVYTTVVRPRSKGLQRARGLLELRDDIEAQPAAEALLAGAAGAASAVRAPEVRALFADVATELYRLTRRAESLRASAHAASSELALIERTVADAPALTERLRRMAAHLDALDAALEAGSEGELMQTLSRLERSASAPGADREAIATARRDVEATLERRAAAEQERARLSAALCQLLGDLRRIYRHALTLGHFDEGTARALEAASAELDAFVAS